MEEVSFSKELLWMMENMTLNRVIVSSIADKKDAAFMKRLLCACNRNGVKSATMINIFKDLDEGSALNDD